MWGQRNSGQKSIVEIFMIVTVDAYRKCGVATILEKQLEDECRSLKIEKIVAQVCLQQPALNFFEEKRGYSMAHAGPYLHKEFVCKNTQMMVKEIAEPACAIDRNSCKRNIQFEELSPFRS